MAIALPSQALAIDLREPPAEQRQWAAERYAQQFGVSLDEAYARLELQTRGTEINGEIVAAAQGNYAQAGLANGSLIVRVADDDSRRRVESTALRLGIPQERLRVEAVGWTDADADGAMKAFRKQLRPLGLGVGYGFGDGGITVRVDRPELLDDVRREVDDVRKDSRVPIRIEEASDGLETAACNALFCDPPLRGGVEFNFYPPGGGSPACSVGFSSRSPVFPPGRYFLTAGHCTYFAGNIGWCGVTDYPFCGVNYGSTLVSTYTAGGDTGLVAIDNPSFNYAPAWRIYGVDDGAGIYNAYDPVMWGHFFCHSGRTTQTSCGQVIMLTFDTPVAGVPPAPDAYEYDLIGTTGECAQGGDSGGPMVSAFDSAAMGVLSASSKGCPAAFSLYEKVSRLQSVTGTIVNTVP